MLLELSLFVFPKSTFEAADPATQKNVLSMDIEKPEVQDWGQ